MVISRVLHDEPDVDLGEEQPCELHTGEDDRSEGGRQKDLPEVWMLVPDGSEYIRGPAGFTVDDSQNDCSKKGENDAASRSWS